jgi:hypothetical protein
MPFLKIAVTEEFHRALKVECARSGRTIQEHVLELLRESPDRGKSSVAKESRVRRKDVTEVTEDDLPTEGVAIEIKPRSEGITTLAEKLRTGKKPEPEMPAGLKPSEVQRWLREHQS